MKTEQLIWVIGGVLLGLWVILFIIVMSICAKVKKLSKQKNTPDDYNKNVPTQTQRPKAADSVYSFGNSNITPGEELSSRYTTQPIVPPRSAPHPSKSLPPGGNGRYDYPTSSSPQRSTPSNNYNYNYQSPSPRNNTNNNFMY